MTIEEVVKTKNVLADKSEDYQQGYYDGYHTGYNNKLSEINKVKKQMKNEYQDKLNSLDISCIYPFNVLYDFLLEPDQPDKEIKLISSAELLNEMFASCLTDRELNCLRMYYGENMTLEEIGNKYELSRARVQQIIKQAIRKLRHPARLNDVIAVPLSEYRSLEYDYAELKRTYEALNDWTKENQSYDPKNIEDIQKRQKHVMELDLSVRSYNCLVRSGIDTIDKLVNTPIRDLMRIRNMGRRSLHEILDKLNMIDLHIEGEDEYRKMYPYPRKKEDE